MTTSSLTLNNRIKLFIAQWMVKLGRLTHDDFTKSELQALLSDVFPYVFSLDIPIGTGTVNVLEGNITFDNEKNRIGIQCLASLKVEIAKNTVYRAHVVIALSAQPHYDVSAKTLYLTKLSTDAITLVNDDYALLRDTQFLMTKFFPKQVNTLFGAPLKSALSLFTAGTSDIASNYLQVYLSGSKQAVLDYHKPKIDLAIKTHLTQQDLSHTMRHEHWRELLFSRLGKSVRVEDNVLRFYLV